MPNGFGRSPPAPDVSNPFTDVRARSEASDDDYEMLSNALRNESEDDSDSSTEMTSTARVKPTTTTATNVRDAEVQTDESDDQKAARLLKKLLLEETSLLR